MALRPRSYEPEAGLPALFEAALASLPKGPRANLAELRRERFRAFQAQGFPTPRIEAWKYSNLGKLAQAQFVLPEPTDLAPGLLDPWLLPDTAARLVFVDGLHRPELSHVAETAGLRIADLIDAGTPAEITDDDDARALSLLNTAFLGGGPLIEVEPGASIAVPVQIVHVLTGRRQPVLANARQLVRLGAGAALTLIETHLGQGAGQGLLNLSTRAELGDGAKLAQDRIQVGDAEGHLIGRYAYALGRGASLVQTTATLGFGFVRNESVGSLDGENGHLNLNGLFHVDGRRHVDTAIRIDHRVPNGESDQYFRGVLDDRAHAAVQGKIHVHPGAQKTNAFQTNNNLLLSEHAEIDTKPELEIYADDVKCSHGATAGELDDTPLFYLRTRGVDTETARSMLTYAFMDSAIERFTVPAVAAQVRGAVLARLIGGADMATALGSEP